MSVELWKSIFDWAAVVLVGLTFIAGAGALITGKILADRQDAAMGQLKLDTAEAIDRASQADLKRVALQNRMVDIFGSRQLTPTQSARIARKLIGLNGVKMDVYVVDPGNSFTFSEDSIAFGRAVVNALRAAKIDAKGWVMDKCFEGVEASTMTVASIGDLDGPQYETALRVIHAFKDEVGVYPKVSDLSPACESPHIPLDGNDPNKRMADANIRITIGKKVQPILTREMLEPTDEK